MGADGKSTTSQTIGHGTFAGKFTITPSLCPGTAACTVTDAQIQTEITNQINAHALPAPQTDAQGVVNTYYAIYFPPNVTISVDPTTRSCVSGGFCAYHSNTSSLIPYGVIADLSTGGCSLAGACGTGTTLQVATTVSSHEMAEAITDPQVGSASVFGPPLGWYDNPPNLGEIADLCDPGEVTVKAGAATYSVEQLFSNVLGNCTSGPPNFSMPSPAGGGGPGVPFNMTLTILANEPAFITPLNYLGTVHFTSSDPGAVLPADYTFTAADAGVHTFPFTLTVLGNQTITVTDTRSSGFTGTTTVNVNTTPDMTVSLHHTGNFAQGQVGATYTIVASNLGGGPTSGTVTVADTLPNGMTATAMAGPGWTCAVNTVTCTRADALPAGGSYPPITLTLNISVTSSTEINIATVSGGGETVTSDNLASDPTTIVTTGGVDLGVGFTANQLFASLGDTGLTLTANVGNGGSIATSGTVTLLFTLPQGMTATGISGTGWTCTVANLTCTRSDVLASAQSYPSVTITFNVALTAPLAATSISVAVSGGGTDVVPVNNTSTIPVNMERAMGIASGGGSATVLAGGSTVFRFNVFGNVAAGTITFSCTGLPAAAACKFNPASVTNASVFVDTTITTTARSAAVPGSAPENRRPLGVPAVFLLAGLVMASMGWIQARSSRRRLVPIFGACMVVIVTLFSGCGGGGGGSTTTTINNTTQGTPAGTYNITFTATSPVGSDTRAITLTVR